MPNLKKKIFITNTLTKDVPLQVLYLFRKKYNNKIRQLSKNFMKIMKESNRRHAETIPKTSWQDWSIEKYDSWDW